jgi:hypothetical protein
MTQQKTEQVPKSENNFQPGLIRCDIQQAGTAAGRSGLADPARRGDATGLISFRRTTGFHGPASARQHTQ